MEHVERAGVHSGDSVALYPAPVLTDDQLETLVSYTERPGSGARRARPVQRPVRASSSGTVYVIEVNPRASRTVPFLSKVTGVPMVDLAVRVGLGERLRELPWGIGLWPAPSLVAAKAPVFSMSKLTQVDTYLGPEMKSTGEVMGIGATAAEALGKALLAAGSGLPTEDAAAGCCSRSPIATNPKRAELIRLLAGRGFDLFATEGTARYIAETLGLPVERSPRS